MNSKFDYNSIEVTKILNNPDYNDAQKKEMFEKYKSDLQVKRRKEIVSRVNELAQRIPVVTQEIYINFLKNYEEDNLTKPFDTIEKEIKEFEAEMTQKYNDYLAKQKEEEERKKQEEIKVEPEPQVAPVESEPESAIFEEPIKPQVEISVEDEKIEPTFVFGENSVLNEEPEKETKPLFEDDTNARDVMPNSLADPAGERGNASAIILSIIAIIVGAVVMYTIIKMN